jgi:hypothetical protein
MRIYRSTRTHKLVCAKTAKKRLTHEVSDDGERANAHASESGSGGDVAVELLLHGRHTVAHHDHLLISKLPGHV